MHPSVPRVSQYIGAFATYNNTGRVLPGLGQATERRSAEILLVEISLADCAPRRTEPLLSGGERLSYPLFAMPEVKLAYGEGMAWKGERRGKGAVLVGIH